LLRKDLKVRKEISTKSTIQLFAVLKVVIFRVVNNIKQLS